MESFRRRPLQTRQAKAAPKGTPVNSVYRCIEIFKIFNFSFKINFNFEVEVWADAVALCLGMNDPDIWVCLVP